MEIKFKFDKKHEYSTIRKAYIDGKDTGYSIRTVIRPTLYEVSKDSIRNVEICFISLAQAKEYVIEQLQKEK